MHPFPAPTSLSPSPTKRAPCATRANARPCPRRRRPSTPMQGLLMSTPELFNSPAKWGKLWLHESERVYADRLVTLTDLEAYSKAATNIAKK